MADQSTVAPTIAAHGATVLPAVEVDSYNIETRDDEGFIGDRASKGAFRAILDNWRKLARKDGDDPLGDEDSEELSKEQLDAALTGDDVEAAGLVHTAIEEFAQEFALVIRRYLKAKAWQKTERVVIGGGFRASRVGEIAIGRTGLILKADKIDIDLVPVRRDPDEAGLIGVAASWRRPGSSRVTTPSWRSTSAAPTSAPAWSRRTSSVPPTCRRPAVWKMELWKHADEDKLSRGAAIERLIKMLDKLADPRREGGSQARAVHRHRLPRHHPGGRLDRPRRSEPAGQLGEQVVQPAGRARRRVAEDRRRGDVHPAAQRRRGAGAERSAVHAGRQALGRADDRYRARQCAVHQPRAGVGTDARNA